MNIVSKQHVAEAIKFDPYVSVTRFLDKLPAGATYVFIERANIVTLKLFIPCDDASPYELRPGWFLVLAEGKTPRVLQLPQLQNEFLTCKTSEITK